MHQAVKQATIIPGIEAVTIVSDRTFARHTHDEFGLGYICRGGQDSWSGRGHVEACAGNIITVNPGEVHDGVGRKGAPRHWRMLYFDPAVVTDYTERPLSSVEFAAPVLHDLRAVDAVAGAVDALTSTSPSHAHAEQALILAFDACLGSICTTVRPRTHSSPVTTVLDLMMSASDEELCLDDFAQVSGLSRFQILRLFSREVGTTPHTYLIQHRVKRAKRRIAAGMPLAEAAIASGFSDQSHMTRAFTRQFGVPPSCYATRP